MEACEAGDLLSYVRRRKKLEAPLARHIFKQIVYGLGYVHSKGIIHRDVKLENILMDSKGNIKLSGFGISKILQPDEKFPREKFGTLAYMAPEMVSNKGRYNHSVDIWSLGVVLYVMIYGKFPFNGRDQETAQEGDIIIQNEILSGNYVCGNDASQSV